MDDMTAGGDGCGAGSTWEVGLKPMGASPYDAQNMGGNVREWVADWYEASGYDPGDTDNPTGPATGSSMRNTVPWPSSLSTVIDPSCAAMIFAHK